MKSKNKKIKPDKKRISMIEIRGISGLLKFAFVVICAAAGFVVFPGVALMFIWNTFLAANTSVPSIGLFQGLLLYAICVVIFLISKGTRFSLSCSFMKSMKYGKINLTNFSISVIFNLLNRTSPQIKKSFSKMKKNLKIF